MDPRILKSNRAPEINTLIEALSISLPENKTLQEKLLPLLDSKKAYIKKLNAMWSSRFIPELSADQVQKICVRYYQNQGMNEARRQLASGKDSVNTSNQKYVQTFSNNSEGVPCTLGYNPYIGKYEVISFEGEMNFSKIFGNLINYDETSKSIDVFESVTKIILKGNKIGLSKQAWENVMLEFARIYMPATYPLLSTFSQNEDEDILFFQLSCNLNTDTEVAKTRSSLGKVTRKQNDPVHISAGLIKSLVTRIISLTFPTMETELVQKRGDFLTCNILPNMVSLKMAEALKHQNLYQASLGEKTNLTSMCQYIESQEILNADLKLQHAVTIPSSCLYTELATSESSIQVESNFTKSEHFQTRNKYDSRNHGRNEERKHRNNNQRRDRYNSKENRDRRGRSYSQERYRRSSSFSKDRPTSYRRSSSFSRNRPTRSPRNSADRSRYGHRSSSNNWKGKERSYQRSSSRSYSRDRNESRGRRISRSRGENKKSRENKGKYEQRRGTSAKSCHRCGRSGHLAKNCKRYRTRSSSRCKNCSNEHETVDCKEPRREPTRKKEVNAVEVEIESNKK